MAEPIKFVQLDCHFDDDKFDFIEAQFGLKGFAIIVKLLQRIYGGFGYYCEWNDRVSALFAKNFCSDAGAALVQEVVKAAINEKIFDRTMYEKFGILTSHGIQKRFYSVAKRREIVFDKPEYVLFIPSAQNSDNVDISAENVCNNGQNVCNETTSKVKSSKVKRSKANLSKVSTIPPAAEPADLQRNALICEYGESIVLQYEIRFDEWQKLKKAVKADKYKTISKWLYNDVKTRKTDQNDDRGENSSFDLEKLEKIAKEDL